MTRSWDRRSVLAGGLRAATAVAAGGVAGALASACTSPGQSARGGTQGAGKGLHPSPGSRAGVGKGDPRHGGNLVFGTETEESGFDPTYARFDSTGVLYARTVYDPLAIPLADGTIAPYLAHSIVPNADYTEWTITLRPNLVFHDGTSCDGAALAFCLEQCLASPLVNFALEYVEGLTRQGDLGVRVRMRAPWVPFPAWLAGYPGGQIAYASRRASTRRPERG